MKTIIMESCFDCSTWEDFIIPNQDDDGSQDNIIITISAISDITYPQFKILDKTDEETEPYIEILVPEKMWNKEDIEQFLSGLLTTNVTIKENYTVRNV